MRNGKERQTDVNGTGSSDADLSDVELREIVYDALANVPSGSRVLAIISDKTRDDNTDILFPAAAEILFQNGVEKFDALVAYFFYSQMTTTEKLAKIGTAEHFAGTIFDHNWDDA